MNHETKTKAADLARFALEAGFTPATCAKIRAIDQVPTQIGLQRPLLVSWSTPSDLVGPNTLVLSDLTKSALYACDYKVLRPARKTAAAKHLSVRFPPDVLEQLQRLGKGRMSATVVTAVRHWLDQHLDEANDP